VSTPDQPLRAGPGDGRRAPLLSGHPAVRVLGWGAMIVLALTVDDAATMVALIATVVIVAGFAHVYLNTRDPDAPRSPIDDDPRLGRLQLGVFVVLDAVFLAIAFTTLDTDGARVAVAVLLATIPAQVLSEAAVSWWAQRLR
jgi:hypothetical protein